jgi:imidazolonepropionase-like amidohydrolase
LRAAVEVAHALGVRVMAHSTGPAVADLVECGVDAIEHGCSIEPAVVDRMAARGIAWTPTLATVEAHLRQAEAFGVSTAPRTAWTERMQRTLSAAVRAGVSVLVGTDELPHGSFVREMEVMVRLGLTPTEAVAAATTTARRFLGLSVIELGAPADVVTYHHDPRLDLATIARPAAVIAAGRMLDLGRPSDAAEGAHG